MISKILGSEKEYRDALAEAEELVATDPEPTSPKGERLKILALLIQTYEKEQFKFGPPDPIDAILHRMEEQGLRQRDLVPYVGSKSKVSEVLSRKRPLTLQMIRALHSALDIPAEVLLQEPRKRDAILFDPSMLKPALFPIKEMLRRGWISEEDKPDIAQFVQRFFPTTRTKGGAGAHPC